MTALVLIGGLTALIGDLATHVGCCLGLLPAVTAITFVAMGTSLPDTFASKQVRVRVRVKVRIRIRVRVRVGVRDRVRVRVTSIPIPT